LNIAQTQHSAKSTEQKNITHGRGRGRGRGKSESGR